MEFQLFLAANAAGWNLNSFSRRALRDGISVVSRGVLGGMEFQ
jgi:hypothetical protein